MEDIAFGLLLLLVGGVFCFFGYLAFRFIIPLWGAFVGFSLGAGLIAAATDEGFLRTGLAWLVALALAFVFALLAYFFYVVAVVLAMGSIGFALGASLMGALGVDWNWLVVLVGIAAGVLLALLAIAADLPLILLVVLSALAGASAVVTGLMLLFGAIDTEDFTSNAVTSRADNDWWWYALYFGFAFAGGLYQVSAMQRMRISMRESWESRGSYA